MDLIQIVFITLVAVGLLRCTLGISISVDKKGVTIKKHPPKAGE